MMTVYLIYHGRMLQLEISDYYWHGQSHRTLLVMFDTVSGQLPHDRPFVFVNAGRRKAVEEFLSGCRGHDKLFFGRPNALWQLVDLPGLADFLGRPFEERLVTISSAEIGSETGGMDGLVFTDHGFVVYPKRFFLSSLPVSAGVRIYKFEESRKGVRH
jgi:hypothetical protein